MRTPLLPLVLLAGAALPGCSDDPVPGSNRVTLASDRVTVEVTLEPFAFRVLGADGREVLTSSQGADEDPYGGPAGTVDAPLFLAQTLPGWDGYVAQEAPWRRASRGVARDVTPDAATFDLTGEGATLTLRLSVVGGRVRVALEASGEGVNKVTLPFHAQPAERFFGMGERFVDVDHRGTSLYSWAEEGGLGGGEDAPGAERNPYPNGPSMTYFPVPFFLSSAGYAVHLDTTYRSEVHFGSERADAFRVAVNAPRFEATIYVSDDPLSSIGAYTEDTGRPPVPAPWVFGPRRRVNVHATALGVPELQLMRERGIAVTAIDDAVHFLPNLSHLGREEELAAWTTEAHAWGYKAQAYNNPYVAQGTENAAADYAYGLERGLFIKLPSGEPALTEFVSGSLLTIATIDLTNPEAVTWFQTLLRRTLALGYDGWMHDFGEYVPRDAVLFDGRRGDEVHNEFPVLSAKAAHDLLEAERPGDYLFFVRSGYSGTQRYVPAVWGGDAEATFDETQGLPSAVRGGVNLSMSGAPYWGSDMTGFKCITSAPNDKEMFLRWVELGAVSPIMMEQDACANPIEDKSKWSLWSDDETIAHYGRYSRLHTRLLPYFMVLAHEASVTGAPLTRHPFLVHPAEPDAGAIDDAFYLGPSLYASPVVRRGQRSKETWLPPGRFLDLEDHRVLEGGRVVTLDAPLGKLPLFLVADSLLPLLDPSIDTLAPATDPSVVTLDDVADRLDVRVALTAAGRATMILADGTELEAIRLDADAGNPTGLPLGTEDEIASCTGCYRAGAVGDVDRIQITTELGTGSEVTLEDVRVIVRGGPARRVRWDVARLR